MPGSANNNPSELLIDFLSCAHTLAHAAEPPQFRAPWLGGKLLPPRFCRGGALLTPEQSDIYLNM